jgi:hypothetical protein
MKARKTVQIETLLNYANNINHLEELDLVDAWEIMSEEEQDQYILDNA